MKIIPRRKIDLTINFYKIDLGIEAIVHWKEFEKRGYQGYPD